MQRRIKNPTLGGPLSHNLNADAEPFFVPRNGGGLTSLDPNVPRFQSLLPTESLQECVFLPHGVRRVEENFTVPNFVCDFCHFSAETILPCSKFIRLNGPNLTMLPGVRSCEEENEDDKEMMGGKTTVVIQDCVGGAVAITSEWVRESSSKIKELFVKRCGVTAVPDS